MQARQLQLPAVAVHRRQVLDVVVGVEARRLHDLVGRERGRQVVGPEQQRLGAIVPLRHRLQDALNGVAMRDVAARQHGEGAEAEAAAQELAPVDRLDQRAVLLEHALVDGALGPERRRRRGALRHGSASSGRELFGRVSIGSGSAGASRGTSGPPVSMATSVFGTISAKATCTSRKPTMATMPRKCTRRAPWKS